LKIHPVYLFYPPVESCSALLLPNSVQGLPEGVVFVALLPQTSACHFVGIGDAGGDGFGNSASHHELQKVAGSLGVRMPLIPLL